MHVDSRADPCTVLQVHLKTRSSPWQDSWTLLDSNPLGFRTRFSSL